MGFADLIAAADGVALQVLGGDPVRYSPRAWGPFVDVLGVFEEQYQLTTAQETTASLMVPAVFVRLASLSPYDPDTDEEPTVTTNGKTYRVRESKKDGLGGVLLMLGEMAS